MYIIKKFLVNTETLFESVKTHDWNEALLVAEAMRDLGYLVEIFDDDGQRVTPPKKTSDPDNNSAI